MARTRRRTFAAGVVAVLAAAPAVASGQSLHAEVVAGGGWDSNLSRSPGGAAPLGAERVAGGFATATALVGGAVEPSPRDELSLDAVYDAIVYPLSRDLDVQRPSAEIAWLHEIGDSLTLRVAPAAGVIIAEGPGRSGWDVGGNAAVRLRLGSRSGLRVAAGYRHREADDPIFSSDSFRARGSFDLDLSPDTTVALAYTLDVGEDVFYAQAPTDVQPAGTAVTSGASAWGRMGPGGGGYGEPMSIDGIAYVPYSADRNAHTGAVRLIRRFGRGVFLEASYSYTRVLSADAPDYGAHVATAELGWRR